MFRRRNLLTNFTAPSLFSAPTAVAAKQQTSATRRFISSILFGNNNTSIPTHACARRCCSSPNTEEVEVGKTAVAAASSSSIAQQSDQAEYEEILKSVLSSQSDPEAENDDSKSSAKLLRIAMPNLFNELNIVRDAQQLKAGDDNSQVESKATDNNNNSSVASSAMLAHKYLNVDSPEVFAWTCSECSHCFNAPVVERAMNLSGCPQCASKADTLLLKNRPDLLLEVAQNSNDPFLDPRQMPLESRKKLRWKCRTCGCGWEARVCDRFHANAAATAGIGNISNGGSRSLMLKSMTGANCPRCQVRQSAVVASTLRNEWHPIKNGDLDPATTLVVAERKKSVWWLCSVCTHEWFGKIGNRFLGQGCPECTNRKRKTNLGPSIVGHAQALVLDENDVAHTSASSASEFFGENNARSSKNNNRNQSSALSRKLREALLEQKEMADRQMLRENYLRQLEEHGNLKKILSGGKTDTTAVEAPTTTTVAADVVTKKAKPSQERTLQLVAEKLVEKQKELEMQQKQVAVDEHEDEDEGAAVTKKNAKKAAASADKKKSLQDHFLKVSPKDLARTASRSSKKK